MEPRPLEPPRDDGAPSDRVVDEPAGSEGRAHDAPGDGERQDGTLEDGELPGWLFVVAMVLVLGVLASGGVNLFLWLTRET